MYSSRGGNAYGQQQPYLAQSAYGQNVPPASGKVAGPSTLEGRSGYLSAMPEQPKFTSGDYVSSSSHGHGQKGDQLFSDKISDYASMDRRQYERPSAYMGRDLQSESTGRYADSIGFTHQNQPGIYDRMDQASVLRQEQIRKAQLLQSASLDGGSRQADYLAAMGATSRRSAQDLLSYGGRVDDDPCSLSMLSGSSYGAQQPPSILGAAPRRNVDDIMYAQSSSNPGYGVSLPPGRDYATGKGLHGASIESDYQGSLLARAGHSRIDERKDDRVGYAREIERREDERRRDHLREREKDRDRDREREREQERERERERERKRERILERREKERDREHKRGLEIRRERTPIRISRDIRGSSLTKDGRSLRQESQRREASHRRHSPVKEKRREYVCKVYSSSLVDVERDYLSIDKRYPRLFISPECSKVVVNWPRENLKLSIHTPVSFEHDFIEEDTVAEPKMLLKLAADGPMKSERKITVWNAKMILMSGLSQNATDELSSERNYDDRIPHFCNMLRFAILKKENSFMAIGGPWDTVDGGDPSINDSSLVRTVTRHAKDVTELDLKNCRHWNRFLEIHYDRVGKDGLFSHKEVTILYVPDLSECIPSLDKWRDQWLSHKKAIAERERQHALKKEKSREKEGLKNKEPNSLKDLKKDNKSEKKKETESPGEALDFDKKGKGGNKLKGIAAETVGDENGKKAEEKDGVDTGEGGITSEKKKQGESACFQTAGSVKLGKKKIIKKIVKQKKVVDKKASVKKTTKQSDNLDGKVVGEKNSNSETTTQQNESSASPAAVKTFMRKKVAKKVQVVKTAEKEDEGMLPEVKSVKEPNCSEDKSKGKSDSSNSAAVAHDASVKKSVKKKIIRRVPKRKVAAVEARDRVTDSTKDADKDEKQVVRTENEAKSMGKQTANDGNKGSEVKSENKTTPKTKSKTLTSEKQDNVGSSSKTGKKADNEYQKDEKMGKEKIGSGSKMETEDDKHKAPQTDGHIGKREKSREREKSKDEKERKDRDGKDESRSKSNRELKEKIKPEEPPRHPGMFLQTKGGKESKLRSLSLSLDSLLDYTDDDFDESTFELSLFAETLYEMLQYQMGCRLLTFLQKLRIKFVAKRNQRKRQREEISKKESEKIPSTKRAKTDEATVEIKSVKTETHDGAHTNDGKTVVKEDNTSADEVVKVRPDGETDEDDDPKEDQQDDEEMADASPQDDSTNEENSERGDSNVDAKSEKVSGKENDEKQETAKEISDTKPNPDAEGKGEVATAETENKETLVVDKELLQAFRFFDRNRVGYIRVEDMRLIIHNLGKFMSHRDVKELVQSALLESSTGRDDRILYSKLVNMCGL